MRRDPPLHLIRRLAEVPPQHQFTTAITVGEMLYGAAKRGDPQLERRVREIILRAQTVLPFDEAAAEVYGSLRAALEALKPGPPRVCSRSHIDPHTLRSAASPCYQFR